jgi:hypothetical protein
MERPWGFVWGYETAVATGLMSANAMVERSECGSAACWVAQRAVD